MTNIATDAATQGYRFHIRSANTPSIAGAIHVK